MALPTLYSQVGGKTLTVRKPNGDITQVNAFDYNIKSFCHDVNTLPQYEDCRERDEDGNLVRYWIQCADTSWALVQTLEVIPYPLTR